MSNLTATHRQYLLKSTSRVSIQYTADDILRKDDFDDLFDIADDLGVDLGGLDTLDETKQRLIMHLEKVPGSKDYKTKVAEHMVSLSRDERKKKAQLLKLLNKFSEEFEKFQEKDTNRSEHGSKRGSTAIESLLQKEGATKNLNIDFRERIRRTKRDDCLVVVSGETSAGKSSFLNLLLGEKLLPAHHNPCTSVITRITFAEHRTANILYKDGRREVIDDLDGKESWQSIWDKIYLKDDKERETVSSIREVQLYVPAVLLKCGLVFLDSPGIGENDAMDEVITQFVANNDIMGFLYVIKSDNAGGVDEDKLGKLLKVILEQQKSKLDSGAWPFDPKCAIFVCNMWDLVIEEDRQRVYDYALQRLGLYWPGIEQSQVVTMSTKRAQKEVDIDPHYVLPELKLVLDNLKELFLKSLDRGIKFTYKWLENVLVRSVHHLKTIVRRIDSSEDDLADKMQNVGAKLTKLRQKSKEVIETQKHKLKTESRAITLAFKEELEKKAVQFRLCRWMDHEVPCSDDWENIKKAVRVKLMERVVEEFCAWEEVHEKIQTTERTLCLELKSELHLLQEDIDSIENDLHSDTLSSSSEDSGYGSSRKRSLPNLKVHRKSVCAIFDNYMLEPPPRNTVRFVSKFMHPVDSLKSTMRSSIVYDKVVIQRKISEFKKNPRSGANKVSEKFLHSILKTGSKDVIDELVQDNMENSNALLNNIVKKIPGLIESNEALMDHIAMCRVNQSESRTLYEDMMTTLEALKSRLLDYGTGYIYIDDFLGYRISLQDDTNDIRDNSNFMVNQIILDNSSGKDVLTRRITPRGIWTLLYNGFLGTDKTEQPTHVAIKIYVPLSGITETFAEITKLRLLKHDCVAKFLGIKHSDAQLPVYIFSEHLKSLRSYRNATYAKMSIEIPRLLTEVVDGIEYLHSRKLVHMELNTHTITVNLNGEVKLTGSCLPRIACFPLDRDGISVGEFVHLSPDVLQGEIYIACSDIYAMGLLIFELLFNVRPFDNQRTMTLKSFIEDVDPLTMLNFDAICKDNHVTESTKQMIQMCLDPVADKRPIIQDLKEQMKELYDEPCLLNLKSYKQWKPIRRKSSQTPPTN